MNERLLTEAVKTVVQSWDMVKFIMSGRSGLQDGEAGLRWLEQERVFCKVDDAMMELFGAFIDEEEDEANSEWVDRMGQTMEDYARKTMGDSDRE